MSVLCLSGRIDSTSTNFASASDLRDANWPDWYAEYMAAEQSGKELPQ